MEQLPDTVLFDIDGTVADTLPAWVQASTASALAYGVELTADDTRKICSMRFDHVLLERGDVTDRLVREIYEHRELILGDLLHEHARWIEGAEDVLGTLRGSRRIGIVTNSHDLAFNAIDRKLGLRRYADQVVTWDDVKPHGKPRPEPLLLACERFGLKPADTCYVGDSDVDRAATEAAGMPFIHVAGGHPIGEFTHGRSIASIRELLKHL